MNELCSKKILLVAGISVDIMGPHNLKENNQNILLNVIFHTNDQKGNNV